MRLSVVKRAAMAMLPMNELDVRWLITLKRVIPRHPISMNTAAQKSLPFEGYLVG
jgi:hypothetical protein